jgi:hypothetical protein
VVALCLAALPAGAQQRLVIAGGVYDDRPALALRASFVPLSGVAVHVYRVGAEGTRVASTRTGPDGLYSFAVNRGGDYWVAVDSRSIGSGGVWYEQTFGTAGAQCAQPGGPVRTNASEGACFGGRSAAMDDASALATSEHVTRVTLAEVAPRVDFAFSANVVTNAADGDRIQGSLRQFLTNANALAGPNAMRFVPVTRAPETRDTVLGVNPRWWTITLNSPLPALTDGGTSVDGAAYNVLVPSSLEHPHPGRFGEAATIRPAPAAPRIEKPDLEIVAGGETAIVCEKICAVRHVALHGAANAITLRGGGGLEHLVIGAAPDGTPPAQPGRTAITIEGGDTVALQVAVTSQSQAGIIVGPGARLDGAHLDVARCGTAQAGAGIVILSRGSSIRSSSVSANPGAGIVLGSLDGATPATGNTIDASVISSNQAGVIIGPGSSRNVIARNDITWNRLGGITVVPYGSNVPRENRVTANRFDENGSRPIVLDLEVSDPNALARGGTRCESVPARANAGVLPPNITAVDLDVTDDVARVSVRGTACPGQVVEIYQSYVTAGVVEEDRSDLPLVRSEKTAARESIANQEREMGLPSIGEFNYLGAATTDASGAFAAEFTLPLSNARLNPDTPNDELDLWAEEVLDPADPNQRAFSATATDPAGNTSEMSVRRRAE